MSENLVILELEDVLVIDGEHDVQVLDLTEDIQIVEVVSGGVGGSGGVSGPAIYAFAAAHG